MSLMPVIITDEFNGNIESYVSRLVTLREPQIFDNYINLGKSVIVFSNDVSVNIKKAIHTNSREIDETVWLIDFKVKNILDGECILEIKIADC